MSMLGDVALNVRKVADEFAKLNAEYERNSDDSDARCVDLLTQIKRHLIRLPTYLNPAAVSATRREELLLTRDTLELGVLVSARRKDLASFELYMDQLFVYYYDVGSNSNNNGNNNDSKSELPESPRQMLILGLNLVRLLVLSRIAQFHAELEKIPYEAHASNNYIRFAVLLERYLMEGSYHKLLHSRRKAPSKEYISVVELLERTVRNEVATCVPHAYVELAVPAAQRVLMVSSPEEALQIGRDHHWRLAADGSRFVFTREEDAAKKELPCMELIKNSIHFSEDLQKIV